MKRTFPKFFDRLKLIKNKDYASQFRGSSYQKELFDYSTITMCDHLSAIKKQFKNIAFMGYNPETFLRNIPSRRCAD